jgi:hypothetical protein
MTLPDDSLLETTSCRAQSCRKSISGNRYFCRRHWTRIPVDLRSRLMDLFRVEYLDFTWKNPPPKEFIDALRACRDALPEDPVEPAREVRS